MDSHLDYMGSKPKVWELEKGWCQTRYMPKLTLYKGKLEQIPFDFRDMIGALASPTRQNIKPMHSMGFFFKTEPEA